MFRLMHIVFLLIWLPLSTIAEASLPKKPAKICLNMIVKDESAVICRCLASVLPIIDYWVIVDTGSTDGTQQIIKDFMHEHNLPGELHERPWVNFGHNRNEALRFAKDKADYIFLIDADNYLIYENGFRMPTLDKDYYHITLKQQDCLYSRIALINARLNWEWVGARHEYISSSQANVQATLENVTQIVLTDGARSKNPKKYEDDAAIFEAELKKDPNNSRNVFYLAQSYLDAGNYPLALKNYQKRVTMGGFDQEIFYSLLKIGYIYEILKMPSVTIRNSYVAAYKFRKSRLEPLYYLAQHYRLQEDYHKGYQIANIGRTIPQSTDNLFVQQWIYDYGIALELSVCAYWIGKYEECQRISLELLKKDLPADIREIVQTNLEFANEKLIEELMYCK